MPTLVDTPWGPVDIDEGRTSRVNTGIAILDPAIRATGADGNPCILLGLRDGEPSALVSDNDGRLGWRNLDTIQLDWRYNFKSEKWEDTSGKLLEEDET